MDVELDGVWKCLDLTAENKVYERITASTEVSPEEEDDDNTNNNGGGGNSNPGGDFVG